MVIISAMTCLFIPRTRLLIWSVYLVLTSQFHPCGQWLFSDVRRIIPSRNHPFVPSCRPVLHPSTKSKQRKEKYKKVIWWYSGLTLCSLLGEHQHFGGIGCLHLQGWRMYGKESIELYGRSDLWEKERRRSLRTGRTALLRAAILWKDRREGSPSCSDSFTHWTWVWRGVQEWMSEQTKSNHNKSQRKTPLSNRIESNRIHMMRNHTRTLPNILT